MRGMEHKTWATVDKSTWGPGPWQDEPDKEQWADPETGYACLIKRSPRSGGLCGYVGVPEGHPWYQKPLGEITHHARMELTYAALCQEGPEELTICHVPAPGDPEPLWWIGWHHGYTLADIQPGQDARDRAEFGCVLDRIGTETYATTAVVAAECASLAFQAAEAARVRA